MLDIDASFAISLACHRNHHSVAKILLLNKRQRKPNEQPQSTVFPLAYVSKEKQEVEWNGLSINRVPEGWINEIQTFKKLHLGENRLERLPGNMNLLRNLVRLDVQFNSLTGLPSDVFEMPMLSTLKISHNK